MRWLIDMDDTLVMGYLTWAIQHVLPGMIDEFKLPYDATRFSRALLKAQKQSNEGVDEQHILNDMFTALGWDARYQAVLLQRVWEENYALSLYPDTLPFLKRLSADPKNRLFIVSNNDGAPDILAQMGIAGYFEAIITPTISGGQPKPAPDMYAYLDRHYSAETDSVMVGDDPWSDGTFAKSCGITCWLLDRMDRFAVLYPHERYLWRKSLSDVGLTNP